MPLTPSRELVLKKVRDCFPDPAAAVLPAPADITESAPPLPLPPRSRLGVLRHKHFRIVWYGAFGSSIGSWMESTGVRWIVDAGGAVCTTQPVRSNATNKKEARMINDSPLQPRAAALLSRNKP